MSHVRYHRNLHKWLDTVAVGSVNLQWSRHAAQQSSQRKISQLLSVDVAAGTVFEAVTDRAGKVIKLAVRVSYSNTHDVCLVLAPRRPGHCTVVTVWLNHVDDNHRTLDVSQYAAAALLRSTNNGLHAFGVCLGRCRLVSGRP